MLGVSLGLPWPLLFVATSMLVLVSMIKVLLEIMLMRQARIASDDGMRLVPQLSLSLPFGNLRETQSDTAQRWFWRAWHSLGMPPIYQIWMTSHPVLYDVASQLRPEINYIHANRMIADPAAAAEFYQNQLTDHNRSFDLGKGGRLSWALDSSDGQGSDGR